MASIAETIKNQLRAARREYKAKRQELERALVKLDREYGFLLGESPATARGRAKRASSGRKYGAVRAAVHDAIKASKGIKPAQIAEKTGLSSAQVHNSLTGLKKDKLVRAKNGLYTAA
jgi:hypothetical protein